MMGTLVWTLFHVPNVIRWSIYFWGMIGKLLVDRCERMGIDFNTTKLIEFLGR